MNQVTVAGHLAADPEVRFTSSGQKVTTFRVGARGRKGETVWWRITVWGEQFDKMMPYLKKGSPIIVMGEMSKPEIFTDRDGKPQVSLNLTAQQLLFSPFGKPGSEGVGSSGGTGEAPAARHEMAHAAAPAFGQGHEDAFFPDAEIPF